MKTVFMRLIVFVFLCLALAPIGNVETVWASAGAGSARPPGSLAALSIQGPLKVFSNTTVKLEGIASYRDGSTQTVSPVWSVNSNTVAISADGYLKVGNLTENQPFMITATYSDGEVTRRARNTITASVDPFGQIRGKTATTTTASEGQTFHRPCLIFNDTFEKPINARDQAQSWKMVSGKWTLGGKSLTADDESAANRLLAENIPGLDRFQGGRIQSTIELSDSSGKVPNGGIIFGYVDQKHYRYASLEKANIEIGQVGEYAGESGGVKATWPASFPLNGLRKLIVDVNANGSVSARAVTAEGGNPDDNADVVCYSFKEAAAGSVGFSAMESKAKFGDFSAWEQAALK